MLCKDPPAWDESVSVVQHHFQLPPLLRRPLCTPPAVLLVDTSAECLSRLSDTSTSVESIVRFGVCSAMLIDKRGRMPGRGRSKERRRSVVFVARNPMWRTHDLSQFEKRRQRKMHKRKKTCVYPEIWKFTSSIINSNLRTKNSCSIKTSKSIEN